MNRPILNRVRLGAVDYLNVRPLVHGLDHEPAFELRFDPPSMCASLLRSGEIDLGMIPTIAYQLHEDYRVVFGIAIASEGLVDSVALFTKVPRERIRTIAADTSSNTSIALTRVLCAYRFGIAPTFIPTAPDLAAMLSRADAAMLIGDPALFVDHRAMGLEKIDLGAEWTDMTGLPFVWAFWAGRKDAIDGEGIARLHQAKVEGAAASDALADAYAASYQARTGIAADPAVARRYLRENIKYDLGWREHEALVQFYEGARRVGVIDTVQPVRFYAA
ncbi:MAG TPA: menaquinone biosynthesis protein [Vicinamibacterales bacterium]|nr:menaquinone biosynthesis protein [Vicinamibacterales bacterium]